jgi:hypothetical protein
MCRLHMLMALFSGSLKRMRRVGGRLKEAIIPNFAVACKLSNNAIDIKHDGGIMNA